MRTLETATKTDWISNATFRGLLRVAQTMPYARRVRWFGGVVEHALTPLAGFRRAAYDHITFVWPDMPQAERRRLARACCNNFGRTFIENYSGAEFDRQIEQAAVQGDGLEALEEAKAQGRSVLFATAHFGNHEAPRRALTQRGYAVGGLYRPMKNPYFNAHYEDTLHGYSGEVFPQGRKGTAGFVRMLKDGGMGTLLYDVHAGQFPTMPFLGKPAHTATSIADIALKLDALVIPYFGVRQPDGINFDVQIEAPVPLTDVDTMMAELNARLEAQIIARPDLWFWVHNRWKFAKRKPKRS